MPRSFGRGALVYLDFSIRSRLFGRPASIIRAVIVRLRFYVRAVVILFRRIHAVRHTQAAVVVVFQQAGQVFRDPLDRLVLRLAEQRHLAQELLATVGLSRWVDSEADLDLVTALSGSGPAYFFLFMEAMQEAAESLGMESGLARELVLQTARGAAELAQSEQVDVAELRRRVTSPGGTT